MKYTHQITILVLAVFTLSGCRQTCFRRCFESTPAAPIGVSGPQGYPAPIAFPNANAPTPIVADPIPQTPIRQIPIPQGSPTPNFSQQPAPSDPLTPDFPPPIESKIPVETRKESPWEGAPPQVYLGVPEPPIAKSPTTESPLPAPIEEDSKDGGYQLSPLPDAKPAPKIPFQPNTPDQTPSPLPSGSAFPVGIPDFAFVIPDQVATGSRPGLDGGLDWLQKKGYKTVIQLKAPDMDDSADRKQVLKRDMTYYSLNISPENLNQELVNAFINVVIEDQNHPIFIYDRDGEVRGSMWYLYYRLHENRTDEVARIMASRHGLREQSDEQRAMWLAVQNYLTQIQ